MFGSECTGSTYLAELARRSRLDMSQDRPKSLRAQVSVHRVGVVCERVPREARNLVKAVQTENPAIVRGAADEVECSGEK